MQNEFNSDTTDKTTPKVSRAGTGTLHTPDNKTIWQMYAAFGVFAVITVCVHAKLMEQPVQDGGNGPAKIVNVTSGQPAAPAFK